MNHSKMVAGASLFAVGAAVLASACAVASEDVAFQSPDAAVAVPSTFTPPDGNDAATSHPATLCPSSQCPAPFLTCADSTFLCDVDSSSDNEHCGSCDSPCKTSAGFHCAGGRCALACPAPFADCDGIADNACETDLSTSNDNCGACGKKCPAGSACKGGSCEANTCPPPNILCGGLCVDPKVNDSNCGACGVICDDTPAGLPRLPAKNHDYYGCAGGFCNQIKCDNRDGFSEWTDCNHDLPTDGCEANLAFPSEANCGTCGNKCDPGRVCGTRSDHSDFGGLDCLCLANETNCGPNADGLVQCVNLDTDPNNCGGCGRLCPGTFNDLDGNGFTPPAHGAATCKLGSCGLECAVGFADCNGLLADGCEVAIDRDPQNCGACGSVCTGGASQACVAGRCAVEDCETKVPQ